MNLINPRWMYLKAVLLVGIGLLSAGGIIFEARSLRTALLLCLCVWAFARAYYFAFYVIEHYIDPTYRFASLFSFAQYLMQRRRAGPK